LEERHTVNVPALIQQGVSAFGRGQHAAALDCFRQVLAAQPLHAGALCYKGAALTALGRHEEALASFKAMLELQPDEVVALFNCGFVLNCLGRFEAALPYFDRALQIQPGRIDVLLNRGLALGNLGRHQPALASFDAVLAVAPGHPDALHHGGLALRALGRHAEAVARFDQVLALNPQHPGALNERGMALCELERPQDALQDFERAQALHPEAIDTLSNRGYALAKLGRFAEALACLDQVLARNPRHIDALLNRAVALGDRHEEALSCLDRVQQVQPDNIRALLMRGISFEKLDRLEEARQCYDRVLALDPGNAEALCSRSVIDLTQGQYQRGFADYENRWKVSAELKRTRLATATPLWLGQEPLDGRRILLNHEQGFGDVIQFVRYAPLVAQRGGRVLLRVPPGLYGLLRDLEGVEQLVQLDEPLPAHDWHCPLMSLPLALGTTLDTVPADVPYLRADPQRVSAWGTRLGPVTRPRVGLVWAGRQSPPINHVRDMSLALLRPVLDLELDFVCLQKEIPPGDEALLASLPQLARHGESLADFSDTAALIANLDLVLTVDTSVAHLAGALGKPVWIMNRHAACWRWLRARSDSPWYPTARLFRQPVLGDWPGLVRQLLPALARYAEDRQP